jgi:hypothetical protein
MTFKKESAYSHYQTTKNQLMQDAEPGIGTTKSAFHAPTDGFSIVKKFVQLFLIYALHMITVETASLATKDTTLRKEPVSSQASITLTPLIQDAVPGTGIIKSVFHALQDGSSMIKKSVFQFQTNALQVMPMETV